MGQTCHFDLLINFFVKVAEKEVARAKAEEEAQEKRKQANADRKAAKKVEQKKAKMEMKKRKVNYQSVYVLRLDRFEKSRKSLTRVFIWKSSTPKPRLLVSLLFIFGNRFQPFGL